VGQAVLREADRRTHRRQRPGLLRGRGRRACAKRTFLAANRAGGPLGAAFRDAAKGHVSADGKSRRRIDSLPVSPLSASSSSSA
jgi:hypothetical protein